LILKRIKHYQINVVFNSQWKMGKGGSISLGINSLPDYVDASFIFVSDQPYLNKQIINEIISIYQKGGVQIIAPYVEGIQTNPVLFDRIVFNDLKTLTGEQGGKEIINRFQIFKLDWKEKNLMVDIDHPADLEKLNP
jgi:molybdenum cofactor cytidylyltransferase